MADLPQLPSPGEVNDEKQGVFASILESLRTQTSLLFQIDDNTESDETASEKRKRRVKEENTDKKGMFSSALGGLGAGIKGVGGVLNKANPFQEGGLGTKMSILLISGVLFAISKFGDKLVKPLADILKMIDSEGGILDKLKDTELFKSAMETFEKVRERAKTIGDDVEKLLEGATAVGAFISAAYESIKTYVLKFDTNKDGKLDFDEAMAEDGLFDDMKKKIIESVGGYVAAVVGGMMAFHFGPAILGVVAQGIMNARILAAIKGTAATKAAPIAGTPFMTKAVLAKAGVAAIVAGGILGVYNASTNAFANAAKDEKGKIKKESFAGFFLAGGDGEGGFKNAIENAFTGGPTAVGALAGVALGAAGGPFGMIAGGLMGAAIGGLIGAVTGYVGADKMTEVISSVTTSIGAAVDEVATFFGGVVAGIESFIAGDSYEAGKDAYIAKNADPKEVREQKLKVLEAAVEKEQIAYDNRDTSLPQRGKETKLNIAKSKLRTFKMKNDLIEKTIKKVKKVDLTKAYDSAGELPGLYTALEGMDPNEFSKNRFGNTYERTLKKIKEIESSIPAYMLSDFKVGLDDQGFYTGANTSAKVINELTSTIDAPPAERAEVVVMPSVIDKSEIKTFNSHYSSSLGSNNNYSTVRVLNLDGVGF
jgi:hypothetical protein